MFNEIMRLHRFKDHNLWACFAPGKSKCIRLELSSLIETEAGKYDFAAYMITTSSLLSSFS